MNGIGDIIAKVTEVTGIKTVAEAIAKLAGAEGCGCAERQEYLNQLFPFESYKREFTVVNEFEHLGIVYPAGTDVIVTKHSPLFQSVIFFTQNGNLVEKV